MTNWRARGACRTWDPEAFFRSGPPSERLKALCRGCPSLIPCTFDALRRNDVGYQAGMSGQDRRDIRKWDQRQRAQLAAEAS